MNEADTNVNVLVTRQGVVLPDQGLILQDVMLIWREPDKHKPPVSRAVWIIVEQDGDRDIELGEFRPDGIWQEGWYLVGAESPLGDDYQVLMFCEVPDLPPLPEVAT